MPFQRTTPGLPIVMGLLQLGLVSLLVGDGGLLWHFLRQDLWTKNSPTPWIIVEHQVKVQKKTHDMICCSPALSLSSSLLKQKIHTVSLLMIPCFKIDFPSILPFSAHKVLLGNRLGGVLCEGFICRLGTLRSRLQGPGRYDWVGSLPW